MVDADHDDGVGVRIGEALGERQAVLTQGVVVGLDGQVEGVRRLPRLWRRGPIEAFIAQSSYE